MKFPDIPKLYSLFRKFPNVITDSRRNSVPSGKSCANSIFFALKGENFNGNRFAESALKQGCRYAVIDEEEYYRAQGENYILVKDVLASMQELAKEHREQIKNLPDGRQVPFIAITGSNGKTTTKELIKCILSKKYKVLATTGNLNNHIGVPLTILSITNEIEIVVIEMGANHIGEIAGLCEIAQPDYGLITNIGKAHLGGFGSLENVVKAKTELFGFIRREKAKLFINSENDLLMSHASGIEKITYSPHIHDGTDCHCHISDANLFLKIKYDNESISSRLIGKYNFENVVAAICVAKYFGVETQKIKEAIEEYIPSNNRSQIVQTQKNTLILDAYNANPSSMRAAIENFADLSPNPSSNGDGRKGEGKEKWLILGDMLELGEYAIKEHATILALLSEKKFQNIMLVGPLFSKAMSDMKFSFPNQFLYKNSEELVNKLKAELFSENSSLILIKGSRGIKLEKIVEFL